MHSLIVILQSSISFTHPAVLHFLYYLHILFSFTFLLPRISYISSPPPCNHTGIDSIKSISQIPYLTVSPTLCSQAVKHHGMQCNGHEQKMTHRPRVRCYSSTPPIKVAIDDKTFINDYLDDLSTSSDLSTNKPMSEFQFSQSITLWEMGLRSCPCS